MGFQTGSDLLRIVERLDYASDGDVGSNEWRMT
jgi:hypothetical protein